MIRVGVLGAAGRMGRTVCAAVATAPDMELVAAVDPAAAGVPVIDLVDAAAAPGATWVRISASPDALARARTEVAVDFTVLESARTNLARLASDGIHAVVGTTGFTPGDLARLARLFVASNCVIAPNFAVSAVLMMHFAEKAAPLFESAEVIELHHDAKVDAPSGTAMMTAGRMAAASAEWNPDPTRTEVLPGARGGEGPGGIRVHSVRLAGLVAHQEVILGAQGQTLTLRADSYDRSSFMPGTLLAVRAVAGRPGLTVGLEPLLGL
ncbi:MAG: 4-hydroxy-tetrahydrodipicolinate reductase [bacterium]|nr:4-hydroxy-tetrahydrodipicolinate reductase [bacterium]MCY3924393.1 4-hydroxy-tetrahydrodipicolinate reductase [bacterium]